MGFHIKNKQLYYKKKDTVKLKAKNKVLKSTDELKRGR